jgi:hypothetical protein
MSGGEHHPSSEASHGFNLSSWTHYNVTLSEQRRVSSGQFSPATRGQITWVTSGQAAARPMAGRRRKLACVTAGGL